MSHAKKGMRSCWRVGMQGGALAQKIARSWTQIVHRNRQLPRSLVQVIAITVLACVMNVCAPLLRAPLFRVTTRPWSRWKPPRAQPAAHAAEDDDVRPPGRSTHIHTYAAAQRGTLVATHLCCTLRCLACSQHAGPRFRSCAVRVVGVCTLIAPMNAGCLRRAVPRHKGQPR